MDNIKEKLFIYCKAYEKAYQKDERQLGMFSLETIISHGKFITIHGLVMYCGLIEEYEKWKEGEEI